MTEQAKEVRVLLWRHAPTPDNAQGRLQGHTDTAFGADGRALGLLAAKEIIAQYGRPTVIVSSPLRRASESAQLLAQVAGHGVKVVIDEALKQRSYGIWEGMTLVEVARQFPAELAVRNAGGDPDIAGWESGASVGERVSRAIAARCGELMARAAGDALPLLVCVSHGSAIASGVSHLLGLQDRSPIFGHLRHANWVELRYRDGVWAVERFNYGPS